MISQRLRWESASTVDQVAFCEYLDILDLVLPDLAYGSGTAHRSTIHYKPLICHYSNVALDGLKADPSFARSAIAFNAKFTALRSGHDPKQSSWPVY